MAVAPPPKGTSVGTFFTLAANLIGSGLLSLPYTMKRASLIPGILSLLAVGGMNCLSALVIARCASEVNAPSYPTLVGSVLGHRAKTIMSCVLVVYTLGSCVSYVVLLGDVIPTLASAVGADVSSPFRSRPAVLIGVGAALLAPASLLKDLSSLRFNGFGSILCVGYLAILILGRTFIGPTRADEVIQFAPSGGAFVGLPITLVAFCMHYNAPKFRAEFGVGIKTENQRSYYFSLIIIAVFSLAALIYSAVAIAGYMLFGKGIAEEILLNFGTDDIAADVARGALAFIQILSFPIVFNSHRACVLALLPDPWVGAIMNGGAWGKRQRRRGNNSQLDSSPLLLPHHPNDINIIAALTDAHGNNDDDIEGNNHSSSDGSGVASFPSRFINNMISFGHDWRHTLLTFILVAIIITLGTIFTDLALVLGVKGALGGTLIVYVIPGLIYFEIERRKHHQNTTSSSTISSLASPSFFASVGVASSSDPHNHHNNNINNNNNGVNTAGGGGGVSVRGSGAVNHNTSGGAGATPFPGGNSESGLIDPGRPLTPLLWGRVSPNDSLTSEPAPLSEVGGGGGGGGEKGNHGEEGGTSREVPLLALVPLWQWSDLCTSYGTFMIFFSIWGLMIMILGMLATFDVIG